MTCERGCPHRPNRPFGRHRVACFRAPARSRRAFAPVDADALPSAPSIPCRTGRWMQACAAGSRSTRGPSRAGPYAAPDRRGGKAARHSPAESASAPRPSRASLHPTSGATWIEGAEGSASASPVRCTTRTRGRSEQATRWRPKGRFRTVWASSLTGHPGRREAPRLGPGSASPEDSWLPQPGSCFHRA